MTIVIADSKLPSLAARLQKLSILEVIALAVTVLLARWIVRGCYRVYFHPLSHFPGPKLSAFTRVPHVYAILTGSLHTYIARLHAEYGEVVRISPTELSFLSPQAWRDIYGHGSKVGLGSPPPKHFSRYGKPENGRESLLITQDDGEHTRIRRIFSPAFSDRALTQQAPLFAKYVNQLVQILTNGIKANNRESKVDMVKLYNFTTFDIMGDLTFGESLHMLDNNEYDSWVRIIFQTLKITSRISIIKASYPFAAMILDTLLGPVFAKKRLFHFNHAATRVTKRLSRGPSSSGIDIWDPVLSQHEQKGKPALSRAEMDANASLFMLAGTETTASLLSGLTYMLLRTPQAMQTLVHEVRSAFSSSSADIPMDTLAKLPYLNACIKEGLRRYPPAPNGFPHLTPAEGSTICGYYVPPGITVAAHHMPIYTSPTLFKDPLSFKPERWTGDEKYTADKRAALQPFSVGKRDCLGKNMAYHEMRLILAKILYHFDLELCAESEGWDKQKVYLVWEKRPLMVRVRVAGTL